MASLEADFEEESGSQSESRKQESYARATYVGTRYIRGATGKAYPRGEDRYWFQPDTGAMGVRVKAEDLGFLNSASSEE